MRLLARRELSVAECRARLLGRNHDLVDVEAAIDRLRTTGALDDARVARAYARTAVGVKGRGPLRIARELQAKGIPVEIAGAALGEIFADLDESALVASALRKKLRGRARVSGLSESARLYRYLIRQGFSPAVAGAELRRLRMGRNDEDG